MTPHDALFKHAFSDVEHAAGVLRSALPPSLAARFDFATLKKEPGSFVDDTLSSSHTDLLFSIQLDGRAALLYLLLEHQSKVHALMPFRLLVYETRIWTDWLSRNPKARRLPVIVPLVVHHSARGWTAPTSLEDVLDVSADLRTVLGAHLPRQSFVLDDLTHATDEALRARAMTAFGRLVLFSLRSARRPSLLFASLARWADLFGELTTSPSGVAALAALMRYYHEVSGLSPQRLTQLVEGSVGADVRDAMKTTADMLREEGRYRGRQEGRQEGRVEAQRDTALRLLRAKFGPLDARLEARVTAAAGPELEQWLDRILTARSPGEVFGES